MPTMITPPSLDIDTITFSRDTRPWYKRIWSSPKPEDVVVIGYAAGKMSWSMAEFRGEELTYGVKFDYDDDTISIVGAMPVLFDHANNMWACTIDYARRKQ